MYKRLDLILSKVILISVSNFSLCPSHCCITRRANGLNYFSGVQWMLPRLRVLALVTLCGRACH